MMPGASDETAAKLQEKVVAFPSVTEYFSQGHTPEDLLQDLLGDMDLEILDKQEVRFHCNCNRDKVERALISIGEKDLRELAEEGEDVELRCDCCNEPYSFTSAELSALADIAAANQSRRE